MTSPIPCPSDDEELQRDLEELAELQEISRRLDAHEYKLDVISSSLEATKRLLSLKPSNGRGTKGSPI